MGGFYFDCAEPVQRADAELSDVVAGSTVTDLTVSAPSTAPVHIDTLLQ